MPSTYAEFSKRQLVKLIKARWVTREDNIVTSGGEKTKVYLDIPAVIGDNRALVLALHVFKHHLINSIDDDIPTMIAGPTTGAIPLVMGMVAKGDWYGHTLKWSIVRDEPKSHGLGRWFVGAEPGPGDKVILTDDVVSSGTSLKEAYDRITATGAEVTAVVPLVDRSNHGKAIFAQLGVPYLPVLDYKDLDLPPLGAS